MKSTLIVALAVCGLAYASAPAPAAATPVLTAEAQAERADHAAELIDDNKSLLSAALKDTTAQKIASVKQVLQAQSASAKFVIKMDFDTAPKNVQLRAQLMAQTQQLNALGASFQALAAAAAQTPAVQAAELRLNQAAQMISADKVLLRLIDGTATTPGIIALNQSETQAMNAEKALLLGMAGDTRPTSASTRASLTAQIGQFAAQIASFAQTVANAPAISLTAAAQAERATEAGEMNVNNQALLQQAAGAYISPALPGELARAANNESGLLFQMKDDTAPNNVKMRGVLTQQLSMLMRALGALQK